MDDRNCQCGSNANQSLGNDILLGNAERLTEASPSKTSKAEREEMLTFISMRNLYYAYQFGLL